MKISLVILALASSASAFVPAQKPFAQSTALAASRKEFLSQTAAALVAGSLAVLPSPAQAAKYGDFGAGSPGVLNPKDADIDTDILNSSPVQSALTKVRGYKSSVEDMQKLLASDPQANLRSKILKELDFSDLRSTLNTVNTAFEEDTQRGTDLLIRAIIQDITELETANQQKDGVPRSERRLEIMNGKLAKLDKAFSGFLAFAK